MKCSDGAPMMVVIAVVMMMIMMVVVAMEVQVQDRTRTRGSLDQRLGDSYHGRPNFAQEYCR